MPYSNAHFSRAHARCTMTGSAGMVFRVVVDSLAWSMDAQLIACGDLDSSTALLPSPGHLLGKSLYIAIISIALGIWSIHLCLRSSAQCSAPTNAFVVAAAQWPKSVKRWRSPAGTSLKEVRTRDELEKARRASELLLLTGHAVYFAGTVVGVLSNNAKMFDGQAELGMGMADGRSDGWTEPDRSRMRILCTSYVQAWLWYYRTKNCVFLHSSAGISARRLASHAKVGHCTAAGRAGTWAQRTAERALHNTHPGLVAGRSRPTTRRRGRSRGRGTVQVCRVE